MVDVHLNALFRHLENTCIHEVAASKRIACRQTLFSVTAFEVIGDRVCCCILLSGIGDGRGGTLFC